MKNYNYVKALSFHCCITTTLFVLGLIPLIVIKTINIDSILKTNYTDTNPILFLFSFLILLNISFLLFNFYSYWMSFINLILVRNVLINNNLVKPKERWFLYIPLLNAFTSFLIIKRLFLLNNTNHYYYYLPIKKMFIVYSIYFGIMFTLFSTPVYFYLVGWFSQYLNVHLVILVIIWSIILNIIFWPMSVVLLIIAIINTFKSFDYYQNNNKQIIKIDLKFYLFFPFIIREKILNGVNSVIVFDNTTNKTTSFT